MEFEGRLDRVDTRPLCASALSGLLAPMVDSVNTVNAPIIARDRGIAISEVIHDRDGEYQTLLRLTVKTENRTRTFAGTLFGGDKPRIVEINGIGLEAELGPHMLYTVNADRPGFIGRLGSMLGDAGVNIATFNLGRTEIGGDAVALIQVDEPLDEAVLESVRALPDVVQARTLRF
jgi:D-3-phosphoglycerate dehydrogenase